MSYEPLSPIRKQGDRVAHPVLTTAYLNDLHHLKDDVH